MEVPTVLSPTRIALRIAEQIVDSPASARGVSGSIQGFPTEQSSAQRTASQIADIPVLGRGVSGSLQGFPTEQRTTALHVSQERISERIVEQIDAGGDFPSRRAGPRVVLPRQSSAAAGAEQLADIVSSGGPHGFLPGQVSTASPGPVHVDEHLPDSAEWVLFRSTATCKPPTGTDAPMRLPGSHLRTSMSSGLVRGPRGEESGTGTRVPVPVHMTSLLCLLSEAHRSEGLGIPSPLPGCHF